jgi:methyl-accepting chemotaxis protein
MAKESRKMLDEIKNVISESVLIAEKIEKDTKATEDSLEMIREVLDNFVDNVDKLTKLSYNFRHSMEEVLLRVEQLLDSIEDISKSISELNQKFEKLDF